LFRLEAEVAHSHSRQIVHCSGNRIYADHFAFEILGRLDFGPSDQHVKGTPGQADHSFDGHARDRGAERRSPREQIIDVAGDQRLDANRRLHLNFIDVQSFTLIESLAHGDDHGKLE
jgi:hypothetical protein